MDMNSMIKKLGDIIAQKQMNNIIEDIENTLGDMEMLTGKELMTIIMKHDMETANKVFDIYKKNQEDNGVTMSVKRAYENGIITTPKTHKSTSTPSYSGGCGTISGGCGSSSSYSSYSGGCGCSSSRC